ncbi:hypothetical protein CYMTET_40004 [Cymbomonas tetramitiformis]|uniref:Dynein heavy chain n=1 Tax=Cymbomonas tetramitiformis TaxID=36881 RepID=A0AAE0F3P5_9CHLO|nr:hypothetical protein CYMTET_40004 [Cymbomonas tetramitiformis]
MVYDTTPPPPDVSLRPSSVESLPEISPNPSRLGTPLYGDRLGSSGELDLFGGFLDGELNAIRQQAHSLQQGRWREAPTSCRTPEERFCHNGFKRTSTPFSLVGAAVSTSNEELHVDSVAAVASVAATAHVSRESPDNDLQLRLSSEHNYRIPPKRHLWTSGATRNLSSPLIVPPRAQSVDLVSRPTTTQSDEGSYWWEDTRSSAEGLWPSTEPSSKLYLPAQQREVWEWERSLAANRAGEAPSVPAEDATHPTRSSPRKPDAEQISIATGGSSNPYVQGRRLPLEQFDLPPVTGPFPKKAVSRFFDADANWVWRECIVLGYNEETCRYSIQWESERIPPASVNVCSWSDGQNLLPSPDLTTIGARYTGMVKDVLRVNLRFEDENAHEHAALIASKLRERDDAVRRLDLETEVRESSFGAGANARCEPYLPAWTWKVTPGVLGRLPAPGTFCTLLERTTTSQVEQALGQQAENHSAWTVLASLPPTVPVEPAEDTCMWYNGREKTPSETRAEDFLNWLHPINSATLRSSFVKQRLAEAGTTWLVGSQGTLEALLKARATSLEVVDLPFLRGYRGTIELRHMLSEQTDSYIDSGHRFKQMVDREVGYVRDAGERDGLDLETPEGRDPLVRLARAIQCLMDDALSLALCRDLRDYTSCFLTDDATGMAAITFNKVQLIHDKDEEKVVYHPPLEDFVTLYDGLLKDLTESIFHLPVVEVSAQGVARGGAPTRDLLKLLVTPVLSTTRQLIALGVDRSCVDAAQGILPLEREIFIHPEHVLYPFYYAPGLSLDEFEEDAVETNVSFISSLEIFNKMRFGMLVIDCERIIRQSKQFTNERKREAFQSLMRDWSSVLVHWKERLDSHVALVTVDMEGMRPEFFAELRSFVENFSQEDEVLTVGLTQVRLQFETLDRNRCACSDEDMVAYYELLQQMVMLREVVADLQPKLNGIAQQMVKQVQASKGTLLEGLVVVIDSLDFDHYNDLSDLESAYEQAEPLQVALRKVQEIAAQMEVVSRQTTLLGLEPDSELKAHLVEALTKLEPLAHLWNLASDYAVTSQLWENTPFQTHSGTHLQTKITQWSRGLAALVHLPPASATCLDGPGPQAMLKLLTEKTGHLTELLPMLVRLRHPGMRERHWKEFFGIFQSEADREAGVMIILPGGGADLPHTLPQIVDLGLIQKRDRIMHLVHRATHEYQLEVSMEKMENDLTQMPLIVVNRVFDGAGVVKKMEDVIEVVDDQLVTVGALLNRPFAKPFEQRARTWLTTLQKTMVTLECIRNCQKQWLFLEPVFRTPHIQDQLPVVGKEFQNVNSCWQRITSRIKEVKLVVFVCEDRRLLGLLTECNKQMELIMMQLIEYLEEKRMKFPRFFFLSNDEMLAIMSYLNPEDMQYYLCKCFDGIAGLEFNNEQAVTGMDSQAGESLSLLYTIETHNNTVEGWLWSVVKTMQDTLRNRLCHCVQLGVMDWWSEEQNKKVTKTLLTASVDVSGKDEQRRMKASVQMLEDVLSRHLNQPILLSTLITFTEKVEAKMQEGYAGLRYIVLLEDVCDAEHFEWQRCLRYYSTMTESQKKRAEWKERMGAQMGGRQSMFGDGLQGGVGISSTDQQDCEVRILDKAFTYGMEYLGHNRRLVMTPLTERCFVTMSQAFRINLGSHLTGPECTGKTETAKDMAKAVGKQCVIFSCSSALDLTTLGSFLKGTVSSGAWALLDEFDRTTVQVLSVAAQMILSIQEPRLSGCKAMTFEGQQLQLDPTYELFITTCPRAPGRNTPPANLLTRFRPMALSMPNSQFICQQMMCSEGFRFGDHLGRKMVGCFEIASEMLSKQDHYDFSMRAIKSCFTHLLQLRKLTALSVEPDHVKKSSAISQYTMLSNQQEMEESLLRRALQLYFAPMLLGSDMTLFEGLLHDLFPSSKGVAVLDEPLEHAVREAMKAESLQVTETLVQKCVQLRATMQIQTGTMLVGDSGAGKTSCYQVLATALEEMSLQIRTREAVMDPRPVVSKAPTPICGITIQVVNPLAVTQSHLYGEINDVAREWTDGIISCAIRGCTNQLKEQSKSALASKDSFSSLYMAALWLVADGPVGDWAGGLNTALDETRTLSLMNSERVSLPPPGVFSMLFEVQNLRAASPATVSRCGMVFFDDQSVGWYPVVQSALAALPDVLAERRALLEQLYSDLFKGVLESTVGMAALKNGGHSTQAFPTVLSGIVIAHLRLLDLLLSFSMDGDAGGLEKERQTKAKKLGGDEIGLPDLGTTADADEFLFKTMEEGNTVLPEDIVESGEGEFQFDSESNSTTPSRAASRGVTPGSRGVTPGESGGLTPGSRGCMGGSRGRGGAALGSMSKASSATANLKERRRTNWGAQETMLKANLKNKGGRMSRTEDSHMQADRLQKELNRLEYEEERLRLEHLEKMKQTKEELWIRRVFLFAMTWAVGGSLDVYGRQNLDSYLSGHCQIPAKSNIQLAMAMPDPFTSMFDFCLDIEHRNWSKWQMGLPPAPRIVASNHQMLARPRQAGATKKLPTRVFNSDTERARQLAMLGNFDPSRVLEVDPPMGEHISDFVVATPETLKRKTITQLFIDAGCSVMMWGSSCSGKTVITKQIHAELAQLEYKPLEVRLSLANDPQQLLAEISQRLERKRGVLTPSGDSEKMMVFVDDLSMPMPDKHGENPTAELVRLLLEHKGWYPNRVTEWQDVEGVSLLCCAGIPERGPYLSSRLVRHFISLHCVDYTDNALTAVLQGVLARVYSSPRQPMLWTGLKELVEATLALHRQVLRKLLPTPTTMHYAFSQMDVFTILEAIITAPKMHSREQGRLGILWAHEAMRVYGDKLITSKDKALLASQVLAQGKQHFYFDLGNVENLNFAAAGSVPHRKYVQVHELADWQMRMTAYATKFTSAPEGENLPLGVVLFPEITSHLIRMLRLLSMPRGHGLLIGSTGAGRHTIVRLACFVAGSTFSEFGGRLAADGQWREDLKLLLRETATAEKHTTLFIGMDIENQELLHEICEDIYHVLTSGIVPGLYSAEELQEILMEIDEAENDGMRGLSAEKSLLDGYSTAGVPGVADGGEADGIGPTSLATFEEYAESEPGSPQARGGGSGGGGGVSGVAAHASSKALMRLKKGVSMARLVKAPRRGAKAKLLASSAEGDEGSDKSVDAGAPGSNDQLRAEASTSSIHEPAEKNENERIGEFVALLRKRLHVVISVNEDSHGLRWLLRKYPKMMRYLYMNYYPQWSPEGLKTVVHSQFVRHKLDRALEVTELDTAVTMSAFFHTTVRAALGGKPWNTVEWSWPPGFEPVPPSPASPESSASSPATPAPTKSSRLGRFSAIASKVIDANTKGTERGQQRENVKKLTGLLAAATQARKAEAEAQTEVYTGATRHAASIYAFTEHINVFMQVLRERSTQAGELVLRLRQGMSKLGHTQQQVVLMKGELEVMMGQMRAANMETERLLEIVCTKRISINEARRAIKMEEEEAAAEAARAKAIADEAQSSLQAAMPALRDAEISLKALNKADLAELKSHRCPPPALGITIQAMCIILRHKPRKVEAHKATVFEDKGEDGKSSIKDKVMSKMKIVDDYWPVARDLFGKTEFLQTLMAVDPDNLSGDVISQLYPYMKNPLFNVEVVGKISFACRSICQWVRAMVDYYDTKKYSVAPKTEQLRVANEQLAITRSALAHQRAALTEVQHQLNQLEAQHNEAEQKMRLLTHDVKLADHRVKRAMKLVQGLQSEHVRWDHKLKELTHKQETVVADTLLGSGFVSYLGNFPASTRSSLFTGWKRLLKASGLKMVADWTASAFWTDPDTTQMWSSTGLPGDTHSVENAIIIWKSGRWPLILDPQSQASTWIRKLGNAHGDVVVTTTDNGRLGSTLQTCLSQGRVLLLEVTPEQISPFLKPILMNQMIMPPPEEVDEEAKQQAASKAQEREGSEEEATTLRDPESDAPRRFINVGKYTAELHPDFRLALTVEDPTSAIIEEYGPMLNLVDFSITHESLISQLMVLVASKETPEFEESYHHLLKAMSTNRRQLQAMETRVLDLVSNTDGHILDDDVLVNVLAASNVMYEEINMFMSEAERMESEIKKSRANYWPVATQLSTLYFAMVELSTLQAVYQTSLHIYMEDVIETIRVIQEWMAEAQAKGELPQLDEAARQDEEAAAAAAGPPPVTTQRPPRISNPAGELEQVQKLTGGGSSVIRVRMEMMLGRLQGSMFQKMSRWLFEMHRWLFGLKLVVGILESDGMVNKQEWQLFLHGQTVRTSARATNKQQEGKGGSHLAKFVEGSEGQHHRHFVQKEIRGHKTLVPAPEVKNEKETVQAAVHPVWMPVQVYHNLLHLGQLPAFRGMVLRSHSASLLFHGDGSLSATLDGAPEWKAWMQLQAPEKAKLPLGWDLRLRKFQWLMVVKVLRPDRLLPAVRLLVQEVIGEEYCRSTFTMEQAAVEGGPQAPLLCVYRRGANPTQEILHLMRRAGMKDRTQVVAMGANQSGAVETTIKNGARLGSWIVVQNCDLAGPWLSRVPLVLHSVQLDMNRSFRLWLLMPLGSSCPVKLLQICIRFALEPPKDIHASMMCMVEDLQKEEVKREFLPPLLLRVSIFHALATQRIKFGGLAYPQPYYFDASDGAQARAVVTNLIDWSVSRGEHRAKLAARATTTDPGMAPAAAAAARILMRRKMEAQEGMPKPRQADQSMIDLGELQYIVGTIVYGARVYEDESQLALNTILADCLQVQGLVQSVGKSRWGAVKQLAGTGLPGAVGRYVPMGYYDHRGQGIGLKPYIPHIKALPFQEDKPDLFGMHENAEMKHMTAQAHELLELVVLSNDVLHRKRQIKVEESELVANPGELAEANAENSRSKDRRPSMLTSDMSKQEFTHLGGVCKDLEQQLPSPFNRVKLSTRHELFMHDFTEAVKAKQRKNAFNMAIPSTGGKRKSQSTFGTSILSRIAAQKDAERSKEERLARASRGRVSGSSEGAPSASPCECPSSPRLP